MKAYITFLSTNNYLKGVMVLKRSLEKVDSKYPLYCMVTDNISKDNINALKKMGIKIININRIDISNEIRNSVTNINLSHWNNCWDKLNIFGLTQFEKVVYLDCDMLVIQNIDNLFECANLTASTDGIYVFGKEREKDLNAGLMVIEPSKDTFNKIIKFINELPEGNYQDQIIIQKFFSDWGSNKDLHLSEEYNVWVSNSSVYPKEIIENVKVLHYIGKIKPFTYTYYNNGELCNKYFKLYLEYLEEIKKYLPLALSILVPQFNEDNKVIKNLLDSIQLQQNIDFNQIEVIILNDGSNTILDTGEFKNYDFKIDYRVRKENKGVSFTRNELLDICNGEYIMYCDADDMFFNVMGLYIIFQEIHKGFDVFFSNFIEETRVNEVPAYVIRNERVYVHGKVLRKQYLIDKNIRWNNKLRVHEDFYFFAHCFCLTNDIRYCPENFYLWKYRDNSVVRADKDFKYKSYTKCIYAYTELINSLLKRKEREHAIYYHTKFVYTFYTMINDKSWQNKYREKTIKAFGVYWNKFKDLFKESKYKDVYIEQFKVDTKKFKQFIKGLNK